MGVIVTTRNNVNSTVVSAGVTYFYDDLRSKWLSIEKHQIDFSINHKNVGSDRWMAMASGIYSNNIGYFVQKKGTLTSVVFQAKNQTTCEAEIYSDNSLILTVQLTNQDNIAADINVDFNDESAIKCFLKPDKKTDYPFVLLKYSLRR